MFKFHAKADFQGKYSSIIYTNIIIAIHPTLRAVHHHSYSLKSSMQFYIEMFVAYCFILHFKAKITKLKKETIMWIQTWFSLRY